MNKIALALLTSAALGVAAAQWTIHAQGSGPLVCPSCLAPPTSFNHVWTIDPVNGSPPNYVQTNGLAGAMIMTPITVPAGQTMKAYIATNTAGAWSSVLTTFTAGQTIPTAGVGSQTAPWNDLSAFDWSDNNAKAGWKYPLLATVPTYQVVAGKARFATGAMPGAVQQAGPIQPGDEVLLNTGTYAPVSFSVPSVEVVNSGFVTFAPAPGQTPVLAGLNIVDIDDLFFDGVKVQAAPAPTTGQGAGTLVSVTDGGGGPDLASGAPLQTHDIVFWNDDISNADDSVVAGWTQPQWVSLTNAGLTVQGGPIATAVNTFNVSVTGNRVHNLHEGIICNSQGMWCVGNEIYHITDNFISYAASGLTIAQNFLHDAIDPGLNPPYHQDGMQGEGAANATWAGVTITRNLLIDVYDPTNPYPHGLTGIDDYSGLASLTWLNLTVTNNIHITRGTCILFDTNIVGALIAGNTCLSDGHSPPNESPAIQISSAGNSNDRICNNIAPVITWVSNAGVEADNNIAGELAYWLQNADGSYQPNPAYYTAPGWYGPAGGGASTPQSPTATNQIVANLAALFVEAPVGVPPVYNLAIAPGMTTNGDPACGPQTNFAGSLRAYWATLDPAQAAYSAAQAVLATATAAFNAAMAALSAATAAPMAPGAM